MDDETEVIRQQMLETRSSLTEKLERLESKLETNVKDTVSAVTDTVQSVTEAVQDTVTAVKDTVSGTVETVKESVEGTVETVKNAFDIRRHFNDHPWLTLAGCALAGYVGGRLLPASPAPLASRMGEAGAGQPASQGAHYGAPLPETTPAPPSAPPRSREPGLVDTLAGAFAPAMSRLKELAIGASAGLLEQMVLPSLPDTLRKEVGDAIDQITSTLGGKPIRSFRDEAEARAQAPSQGDQGQEGTGTDGSQGANRISGMGHSL